MNKERVNLLKGYNMLLYFGGSMIMNEPTDECVIDFWMNGTLNNLPVSSLNPRFILAASLLRNSCDDRIKCRERLCADYSLLFSGSGLPMAPPRASIYMADIRNGKDIESDITGFYKSYGWEPKKSTIPSDHLGIELLFLTRLIDRFAVMDDDPSCCEMEKEISRFIDNYMLPWLPAWGKDINDYANTNNYKGIGNLIYSCIEDLRGILRSSD